MSSKRKLDRTDQKILSILQQQGRMPITELAQQINLTPTPCAERVKRLEEEGFIDGYFAKLNPERMGLTMCILMLVSLDQTSMSVFSEFRDAVREYDEIEECYLFTGDYDIMLKIRVKDMEAYRNFMGNQLPKLPGIIQTKSQVVIEEVKNNMGPKAPAFGS